MSANAKVLLLISALALLNLAVFAARLELHRALDPILKALGS
jgi:hypothetical protein